MSLRVCVVTSSYPRFKGDPPGSFVHEMCVHLGKHGDEIVVVAPHAGGSRRYEVLDGIEIYRFRYGLKENDLSLAYRYGMFENVRHSPWLAAQIPFYICQCVNTCLDLDRLRNFDIIFAQWVLPQGFACASSKWRLGKPVAVLTHGSDVFLARKMLLRSVARYTLANSDLVLANSSATARRIVEICDKAHPRVVGMGVDLNKFRPEPEQYDSNTKRRKNILFVGKLTEQKGISHLIRAMKAITKEVDCYLTVVGDGPLGRQLWSYCSRNQLQEKVAFLGTRPQSELPALYSHSDLTVIPSITTSGGQTEAFGVVVLEAMACGKAVVAGNVGGIPELVHNEVNGLTVDAFNETELSRAVIRLLRDEELRNRMGTEGRRIAENYSWDIVSSRIHNLLAEIPLTNRAQYPTA